MADGGGLDRRDFLKGVAAGVIGVGLTAGAGGRLLAGEDEETAPPAAKPTTLPTRRLGRTGIMSSVIAYGCAGLAATHVPLLEAAHEHGVNFFDVAWNYQRGQAEANLGAFVAKVPDREKIFLATKASGFRPAGSAREIHEALKGRLTESLTKLKTDYVDLFFWPHGAVKPENLKNEAVRESLVKLKEEGLIRFFGVSTHANYAALSTAAIEDGFHDVIMTVANVCTQKADQARKAEPKPGERRRGRAIQDTRAMLALAKEKDVGIIVMKAAQPGFQSPNVDDLLASGFPEDSSFNRYQKLYNYILRQEGVSSVVAGIRSATVLRQTLAAGAL